MEVVTDALEHELVVAIAERRTGKGAGEMARHLLEKDRLRLLFVGLTSDPEAGIFYNITSLALTRVPFDDEGFDGMDKTGLELYEQLHPDLEWVREHVEELGWVHPRFRWVVEDE